MSHDHPPAAALTDRPWWAHGHVWLIIAGPAAVILAGIATIVLAVRTPDPLVAEDYYRRGIEINKTLAQQAQQAQPASPAQEGKAMLPALQGRNHALTPSPAP